jgi:hypothetical protein
MTLERNDRPAVTGMKHMLLDRRFKMVAMRHDAPARICRGLDPFRRRGATSTNVYVSLYGNVITTKPNDDQYHDSTGTTGQASFMYKVCEAGTQTCSNDVTVNFGP